MTTAIRGGGVERAALRCRWVGAGWQPPGAGRGRATHRQRGGLRSHCETLIQTSLVIPRASTHRCPNASAALSPWLLPCFHQCFNKLHKPRGCGAQISRLVREQDTPPGSSTPSDSSCILHHLSARPVTLRRSPLQPPVRPCSF